MQTEMKNNQVSGSLQLPYRALGLVALSLILGLAWMVSSSLTDPANEYYTQDNRVVLKLPYRGICSDLKIFYNGDEIELIERTLEGGVARVSFNLEVGSHQLTARFIGPVPGLDHDYPLTVVVDQDPPVLTTQLREIDQTSMVFTTIDESVTIVGQTEPGAVVCVNAKEYPTDSSGRFEVVFDLVPGHNDLIVSSTDRAGNRTAITYSAFYDIAPPTVRWQTEADQVFTEDTARLQLEVHDDGRIMGLSGNVDEKYPVEWYAKGGGSWVGKTVALHEGYHQVDIRVVDEAGRVATSELRFVIDSSEKLGEARLGIGARGEDIVALHERLVEKGYLSDTKVGDRFDERTKKAVERFQEDRGYEVTGIVEGETLLAMGPRIVINLSNFSLVLDRPGEEPKRWSIASGSAEYPTPSGRYRVVEKVIDPTWYPPKSEWAKDAKPVPPGPDNPLGTRWIGFDWASIGIHGTNTPWSIGAAVSHGCLRMVTEEVEVLFEMVEVGTPVTVFDGWEDDPLLEQYWP